MKNQSKCRSFVWCLLFPIMVFSVTLASLARFDALAIRRHNENEDGGFQWADAQDSLESCTYQQLETAFGGIASAIDAASSSSPSAPEATRATSSTCWHLTDRILRIPKDAILNFHSLIPLGAGCKGGVFMAFINLSDGQPPCKAVYKTDLARTNLCADVWTHPWSTRWSRTKNCLAAHLNPFGTTMRGELTGGLIFQALRQATQNDGTPLDTSGIMPTWAMVPLHEDDELGANDEHGKEKTSFLRRKHSVKEGEYPGVMGMIMPYQDFRPLGPAVVKDQTAAQVAALLQPAAQGLAYVHQLGLAHQDILVDGYKNVGVVRSPDGSLSHGIIFDWGYTALDDNKEDKDGSSSSGSNDDTCMLGRACEFCVESYFPKPRVGGSHGAAHSRRRTLDCEHLRTIVVTLWKSHVRDAATVGSAWQRALESDVDCSRSTQELADFLATVAAEGETR